MTIEQFLASKWQHQQFLIDLEEMRSLFLVLEPFDLFSTMGLQKKGENHVEHTDFLHVWDAYIQALQQQKPLSDPRFRFYFAGVLTEDPNAVSTAVSGEREIVLRKLPIIQMQQAKITYAKDDEKIRTQLFGKSTISWGIQCSYPQLFQDPATRIVHNALDEGVFKNADLWKRMKRWLRENTRVVLFTVDDKKIKSTIRLGKNCFSWIHLHPELKEIAVYTG